VLKLISINQKRSQIVKKVVYAGIALAISFLSVLEAKADNPFSNFKPYEQDEQNQQPGEATQPEEASRPERTETESPE
jgi:hypothetical protein